MIGFFRVFLYKTKEKYLNFFTDNKKLYFINIKDNYNVKTWICDRDET
ncbi:hypothetical protein XBFFR1_1840093 [Xenorhabdus bovienii str. feltiae France]|nr:hypothetical protein XBFFR1_1840093 [Xenorhabdus bovienii str. feltiae France]